MMRSPDAWRRIVRVCGVVGLALTIAGLVILQGKAPVHRTPGVLAFYSGFALVITAIYLWYRYVPPRPPAPEDPKPDLDASEDSDWE
jgi:hypothetical protein